MNKQAAERVTCDRADGASLPGVEGGNPGSGLGLKVPLPLRVLLSIMREGDIFRIEWGYLTKIVQDLKVQVLATIGVKGRYNPIFNTVSESRRQGGFTSPEFWFYPAPARDL
jgi:hypothetical protein